MGWYIRSYHIEPIDVIGPSPTHIPTGEIKILPLTREIWIRIYCDYFTGKWLLKGGPSGMNTCGIIYDAPYMTV